MNELKVGSRIAKLRKVNSITQIELAEKLGVTDRAVSKWETESSYPDIALLVQISEIFNVSVDYLLKGETVTQQKLITDYANTKYDERINNYLQDGWKIIDMKLSGDGEGGCIIAVLMEKEIIQ